jgi:hypothetical protein
MLTRVEMTKSKNFLDMVLVLIMQVCLEKTEI